MINKTVAQITKQFKQQVLEKYDVVEMKLFGSSARGDSSEFSDIDIMVKLPKVTHEIEEDLFNMAYDLELEHDCLIDIIVLPANIDMDIPICKNIEKEGVAI